MILNMSEEVPKMENPFGDAEQQVLRGMITSAPGIREVYEKLGEIAQLEIVPGTESELLLSEQEKVGQIIDAINGQSSTGLIKEHFALLSDSYGIRSTVERLYDQLGLE